MGDIRVYPLEAQEVPHTPYRTKNMSHCLDFSESCAHTGTRLYPLFLSLFRKTKIFNRHQSLFKRIAQSSSWQRFLFKVLHIFNCGKSCFQCWARIFRNTFLFLSGHRNLHEMRGVVEAFNDRKKRPLLLIMGYPRKRRAMNKKRIWGDGKPSYIIELGHKAIGAT